MAFVSSNELHLAHWLFLFKMYFKTNWSAKRNIKLHNNLIRNIHCLGEKNIRKTDLLKQRLFNIKNLNSTLAHKIVLLKRIVIHMEKSGKIVMEYENGFCCVIELWKVLWNDCQWNRSMVYSIQSKKILLLFTNIFKAKCWKKSFILNYLSMFDIL